MLQRYDTDLALGYESRGYLIADSGRLPGFVDTYLRWDGMGVPGVRDVKALADLVLTNLVMNS